MSDFLKLVIIGDGAVGKTCLLLVYSTGKFPTTYVPTVCDNYNAKVTVDGIEHSLQFWDTAGQEDLIQIRTLSYNNTRIFLLCFSVIHRATFENVTAKWVPEIREYNTTGEIILIGTKTDLRETTNNAITTEEGEALAKQIGAFAYMECSALKDIGVKDVFDRAIVQALGNKEKESGCCEIA